MLYSKELEEIIEAVLADDVITEKERAVLHKRALAEGIDPDELDVVIEGRLAKRKKEKYASNLPPLPNVGENSGMSKTSKYGEIRKCPHCGAIVMAGDVKCQECGYDFVGIQANSTRERLYKTIEEIKLRHAQKKSESSIVSKFFSQFILETEKSEDGEIADAIKNIPVPNTKEDLLEFLAFLEPLANVSFFSNSYDPSLTPAYKAKYKECYNKASIFFSEDPLFIKFFKKRK